MHKRLAVVVLFFIVVGAACVLRYSPTKANIDDLTVDTGCSQEPSYTGQLKLAAGEYDVYAQLGRRGETASVTTFAKNENQPYGTCIQLGTKTLSGVDWQNMGRLSVNTSHTYTLELASSLMANVPNANRPSIMLVPHTESPICQPADECYVTIDGKQAFLRPTGTLLNEDSLHVIVVRNPSEDALKEVRYYVGGRLVDITPTLQEFDNRYIEYAGQPLEQVLVYESGQEAVIKTTAPLTHQDNFLNFIFRLSKRYPDTFKMVSWLLGGIIVFSSFLLLIRGIQRHEADRVHHGFKKQPTISPLRRFESLLLTNKVAKRTQLTLYILLVVMAMGIAIVLTNSYLLQIVTVEGRSMEKSFFTGDTILVNKFPKTLALINAREYLPKRGDVVIVHASFGHAIVSGNDTTNLTLIKRVIGLPGERVVVHDGALTVYNSTYPTGFQPDVGSSWESAMTKDLPNENIDIQLGSSEIFVSGDNRPESIDSRFNGPLETSEIIGNVVAKW